MENNGFSSHRDTLGRPCGGHGPRERAEPLILKCRSFYESLNLKERHGTGWAMGSHDLRTRCEEDTGLCVSDAGL